MKKRFTPWLILGILAGLIIGYVAGLFINFPSVDESLVSGTINKVDKYRNIKATEADIQLKNDLVADTATLRILKNYITFHYLDAVKLDTDIEKALAAGGVAEGFDVEASDEIEGLEKYGQYLGSSRLCFLAALGVIDDPEKTDPTVIRNSLNQVNNIIAQKNYRNRAILSFIDRCESFLASQPAGEFTELRKAHDILSLDLASTASIAGDKVMQKVLNRKQLMSEYRELAWYEKNHVLQVVAADIEIIGTILDADKMQAFDSEKLQALDAEKINIYADAQVLGFLDAESFGIVLDMEKLGYFIITDVEKMAAIAYDMDKLGVLIKSAEKMGDYYLDTEHMGVIDLDAEKMGTILDSEKLGII